MERYRRGVAPFARPYKWWRRWTPRGILGALFGPSGRCYCGSPWWPDNIGETVAHGDGQGWLICNGCYKANKKAIDEHNAVKRAECAYWGPPWQQLIFVLSRPSYNHEIHEMPSPEWPSVQWLALNSVEGE